MSGSTLPQTLTPRVDNDLMAVQKEPVGGRSTTGMGITKIGYEAIDRHLATLQAIVNSGTETSLQESGERE